jgi:hypothetical protein
MQTHPSDPIGANEKAWGQVAQTEKAERQFDQSKADTPKEWKWNTIMNQKTTAR